MDESASALMLETDPSDRSPRPMYTLRYQEIALEQLKSGLQETDEYAKTVGPSEWSSVLKQNKRFALLRADALLARDRIDREIM